MSQVTCSFSVRVIAAATALAWLLAFPIGAAAQSNPTVYTDNPSCADIDQNYSETWLEHKIEPIQSGTTEFDNGDIAGSITVDGAVKSFSFQVQPGVDAVIVKGGPDSNAYVYAVDATSGTGLVAPKHNGQTPGLSHISFCYDLTGSIGGKKWHDLDADGIKDAGEPILSGWKLYLDLNNDGDRDGNEPIASTDANGVYNFGDLPFGTYTVRELPADQQPNTGLTECSFPASCSHTFTLKANSRKAFGNFGNYAPAKLTVVKQTNPDGAAGSFAFSSDVPNHTAFNLSDGQSKGPISVRPGQYAATELVPSGWSLTGIVCTGDLNSTGTGATATFRLISGENVTCTFTNTRIVGAVNIVKTGTLKAHHGDQLTYQFAVTNVGNSPLHDVVVSDDRCAPVTGPVSKANDDGDALLETVGVDGVGTEVWNYTCSYSAPAQHAAGEANPIHNIATVNGKDEENKPVSDTDDHATLLIHPQISVDKTLRRAGSADYVQGPVEAHVGDRIEYRFAVTTTGDPLTLTSFADPRCDAGTLSGPTGDDGDAKLKKGETWIWTCSHVIQASDPDPFDNTVKVTGVDELGGPKGTVEDRDDARVDVIHPDIELDKKLRRSSAEAFVDGPVTARPGEAIEYQFTLTNAGDTELTVVFSDPRCDPGTLSAFAGDTDGDGKLDVTETWVATCTHVLTAADGTSLVNVAVVEGTDRLDGKDTDSDSATVTINPDAPPPPPPGGPTAQGTPRPTVEVLPEAVISGVARLRGPAGCVSRRFTARLTGRRIRTATFTIDGKVVKRFRSAGGEATKVNLRVNLARYGRGTHTLSIRVTYNPAARTAAKTLRMTFARCSRDGTRPRFTG